MLSSLLLFPVLTQSIWDPRLLSERLASLEAEMSLEPKMSPATAGSDFGLLHLHRKPASLSFGILEPIHKTRCVTHMHSLMMKTLREHPQYTKNTTSADLVFVDVDTMLQIMWPERGVKDSTNPDDDPAYGYAANFEGDCLWTDPKTTTAYINTLKKYTKECPSCQTTQKFAYFRSPNYWENVNDPNDLPAMRDRLAGFDMVFIGLDLTEDLAGGHDVNMLQPLLADEMASKPPSLDELCEPRERTACFIGANSSDVRAKIFNALADKKGFVIRETQKWTKDSDGYQTFLRGCDFGISPRGDAHYSFRTTELLNMGVIPVIVDDLMLAPYNVPVNDWAIRIPENQIYRAEDILNAFSHDAKCRLKQNGQRMLLHASRPEQTIEAVLRSLSHSFAHPKPSFLSIKEESESKLNMGVYFISLPDRLDYVNQFIEENNIKNAVLVDAVDKHDLDLDEMREDGKLVGLLKEGEVACTLSHRKAFEGFLATDQQYAMVFEDDSAWEPKALKPWGLTESSGEIWIESLAKTLVSTRGQNEWDVLNLGRCFDICETDKVFNEISTGGQIVQSEIPLCTNAYLISREGAKVLLEEGMPLKYPEDWARLVSRGSKIKTMAATPRLFYQVDHNTTSSIHSSDDLVECRSDEVDGGFDFARQQYAPVIKGWDWAIKSNQ
mmetsp:Transcript_3543/g.7083  ORF Transcript_3543/g.7083 Transcript_3543/m.7083 type:complete len:668 (-) Transcript_3543:223-2226(-)